MFEDYAAVPLKIPEPPVDMGALRGFLQTRCEVCAFSDNQIRYVAFNPRKPMHNGCALVHPEELEQA